MTLEELEELVVELQDQLRDQQDKLNDLQERLEEVENFEGRIKVSIENNSSYKMSRRFFNRSRHSRIKDD